MYDKVKQTEWAKRVAKNWWIHALKVFGEKIGELPDVVMNARLTSTGGRAFLKGGYIDLSCYLLHNNPEEFKNVVIPHELAHHIAFRLYQDKGHGSAWKNCMVKLGLPPDRCHNMETLHMAKQRKA
jgi:SprT protein